MRCRKCKNKTRIIDTRSTATSMSSLVTQARKLFPHTEVKVRRHKCKMCNTVFDSYELAAIDILKLLKKD